MKTRNKANIIGISLIISVLLLAACIDNSRYPKVVETLYIHNETDTTIYVEYGFLKQMNGYGRGVKDSVPKSMQTWFQFDDSLVTNLWMSEQDFNKYVSQLKIYKLVKGDSIFVAPRYYNAKSVWDCKFYGGYESDFKENQNDLTIHPEMFNK